ncbi:hypothetical protein [Bradyrhizobium elkanii]|uniref:hypothetical protein n=1 Tax=Bradyrhizobium elkanii TaxID=29448 RepID=UPI001BA7CE0D|nr:hypothetical protein [Bradyrhizobium elkanii]MBR1158029.1 hypothetical protein [Bradyrhizobium elkanii]
MQECLALLHRKIIRIAISAAMTRACGGADCVIIDRQGAAIVSPPKRHVLRNIHRSWALIQSGFDEGVLSAIETARQQLTSAAQCRSGGAACNTMVVMLGSAALRRCAAAHLNDTSSARNACPAFSAPFASIGDGAARRLALFVHRKASCAAGKATKRRPTAGKQRENESKTKGFRAAVFAPDDGPASESAKSRSIGLASPAIPTIRSPDRSREAIF